MSTELITIKCVNQLNELNFSQDLISEWISFCDVAQTTQKSYNKAVKSFFSYLKQKNITCPTRNDIINFRDTLLTNHTPATTRLYLTATKMFIKWLASKGLCSNFADNVKNAGRAEDFHSRDALTVEEGKLVINSFSGEDIKSIRDKCIMALMMTAGLRSIEVVRLNVGDIERRYGKIFLGVHGKGRAGKVDKVQISPKIKFLLDKYLNLRGTVRQSDPLFVAISNRNFGQRLQTQTVSRLAKKSFRTVGIDSPKITCHSCRHTFATVVLENGVDISKVQRALRHRSPLTTEIYRHDLDDFNNDSTLVAADILLC